MSLRRKRWRDLAIQEGDQVDESVASGAGSGCFTCQVPALGRDWTGTMLFHHIIGLLREVVF